MLRHSVEYPHCQFCGRALGRSGKDRWECQNTRCPRVDRPVTRAGEIISREDICPWCDLEGFRGPEERAWQCAGGHRWNDAGEYEP